MAYTREQIAERGAKEAASGMTVNLGIGLPTLVANYLDDGSDVWIHTENGMLGMGPFPYEGDEDSQVINAGKQTVTIRPGGSCFDSAMSFSMIRAGYVDLAIMGAMQVSARGDLANWSVPGGRVMGIGGAMDLAAGARRVVVLTMHQTKQGASKLVDVCSYPLTAAQVVTRVITDLGVFDPVDGAFHIQDLAPGVTEEQVRASTDGPVV